MSGSTPALLPVRRKLAVLTLLLAFFAHGHTSALAGDYPDRPVKIVVPFPAGGTADAIPRIVADWLSRKWNQPVVIENRTGAAGNIGAEQVYHSAPDGYTLLSSPPPPLVINHNLYPRLGYDPMKFEPIIVMAQVPNALIVNPSNIKASSVPELIAYLKGNSDRTICATQGNGTTSHLTSELFQLMAKVRLRHIPYRGSAPALQGLVAGDAAMGVKAEHARRHRRRQHLAAEQLLGGDLRIVRVGKRRQRLRIDRALVLRPCACGSGGDH